MPHPPRTVRIAILGSSPCHACVAACCRQNGHSYSVLLQGDAERRRFAPWATDIPIRTADGNSVLERVLPYRNGRCVFLGDDNLCTIYDDRPLSCRQFECVTGFGVPAGGNALSHSVFLQKNPTVLRLLESL